MTWTSPHTFVSGELVTASLLNIHIRDNLLELRATPVNRCVAYHSTTQVVTAGNTTALNLDSEDVDTASMHSTSSSTNQVTIPSGGGGFYICIGQTEQTIANGILHLRKGGTSKKQFTSAVGVPTMTVVWMGVCAAADIIDLAGQALGADTTFGSATAALATRLTVVGPWPPS